MNYLAHLHLGGDAPAQLLGSLYGDFVKGPLAGQWPADIEAAIHLHRRIDVFTDNHPLQAQARAAEPQLPERLALIAPRMAAQDWLGSYREFAVLEQVVAGIDRRLSRPGLLIGGLAELERLYQPLLEDFRQFYPELQAYVARERGLAG